MDAEELKALLATTTLGKTFDFRQKCLRTADFRGADLRHANFEGADLDDAILSGAYLREATFQNAYLAGANFSGADLTGANLKYVSARYTTFTAADLRNANLTGADLAGANFSDATLPHFSIVPEVGSFHAYKVLYCGIIAEIRIEAGTPRVSSLVSRKCRAERATVVSLAGGALNQVVARGMHDSRLLYEVGKEVVADAWDDDIREDCTHGIHFFMTRAEAVEYYQL